MSYLPPPPLSLSLSPSLSAYCTVNTSTPSGGSQEDCLYSSRVLGVAVTSVLAVLVVVLLIPNLFLLMYYCRAQGENLMCCYTHKPSALDTLDLQEMGETGSRNKQFDEKPGGPANAATQEDNSSK